MLVTMLGCEKRLDVMKTTAAVLRGINQDHAIETIELDPPKAGEVAVRIAASGMCHSDEHNRTGDSVVTS